MVNRGYRKVFYYSIGVLGLNLATILLGVAYLIFPGKSAFWDLSGWLFLVSWVSSIILPLFVSEVVDLCTPQGKRINRLGYILLMVSGATTICMFGTSFLLSGQTSNIISEIGGLLGLLYGCFFGTTAINSFYAFFMIKQSIMASKSPSPSQQVNTDTPNTKRTKFSGVKKLPFVHIGVLFIFAVAMGGMIYFALLSLLGTHLGAYALPNGGVTNGLVGLISATFGWLFSIFTWAATVGGMKILRGLHLPRVAIGVGIIGILIGSILVAPMIFVPMMTSNVSTRFGEAYGWDWETRIPTSVLPYFKSNPLVAAQYFLPRPLDDCILLENVSFYNGSVGIDNGLQLYFDAYLPLPSDHPLPGANSTLIRIHGGGWTVGDKGSGNMPLMNRYFAAQGYCVFDIQYGLNNQSSFLSAFQGITPDYVMGNFSINDMVRHIGIFCQFLTLHQAEYHANLNSVFISGGSAGGHLTCITALAIASGNYSSIFGTGITIKGYIPFYPANKVRESIDGGVSPHEFYNAALLVTSTSPPCLIYQGKQDGLVNPEIPQNMKDTYMEHGNPACLIIYLPFAGHGSDIDFYGYFNQFFLYYMERFLYLYR